MICLKCGNEIKENEQICEKCGYNKNTVNNNDNPYGITNRGVYNPNAVDKEKAKETLDHQKQFQELVEIYIGPKYYNFKKGKFSWCAFFLGPLYILYRKMIGVGLIVYLINILIAFLFSSNLIVYIVVSMIFNLFLGLSFKKIYFEDSMEKVGHIKKTNPDKGFNQLTEIVKVKGGTNILYPILLIVTIIAILTLIIVIIGKAIISQLPFIPEIIIR